MTHDATATGPLIKAWIPFRKALGFATLRTQRDYKRACALIGMLVDEIGENEEHPLADLLDYLSNLVMAYEDEHANIPDAEPREILRFLMEQNGFKQSDLADCAPQGRISDILNGRREISKDLAKALAAKFNLSPALFI